MLGSCKSELQLNVNRRQEVYCKKKNFIHFFLLLHVLFWPLELQFSIVGFTEAKQKFPGITAIFS